MLAAFALVLTTSLAAQDGFGGAPARTTSPAAEAPCRVQLDDGRWITCAEVLSQPRSEPSPSRSSLPGKPREQPTPLQNGSKSDERPPLELPDQPVVKVDSVEPDFEAELDADRFHYDRGPWGAALRRAGDEREPSLLAKLRRRVSVLERKESWYRAEVEAGRRQASEHEAVRLELVGALALLSDVEVLGLRLRQACADRLGDPAALPPERMPQGLRLSLDQPLLKSLLLTPDPEKCDREVLVTEAVVERASELQSIERRLKTESFGYFNVDERRRLQARRAALLDELKGNVRPGGARMLTADDGLKPISNTFTEPEPLVR